MSRNSSVAFKGNKEGLSIYLNADFDYISLKEQLIQKIESAKLFFEGAKVISIQGKCLSNEEKEEIKSIINSHYGMTMDEKIEDKIEQEFTLAAEETISEVTEEGITKFFRTTIRSGQSIKFEGNVVIIGDVNPGGEVIADGNILVMGSLRGMAHAGAKGSEKAFVAAFCLQPTQLRIANIISRSPDNEYIIPSMPELAMVKNSMVVIEPYLPKK